MKTDIFTDALLFWSFGKDFVREYLPKLRRASWDTVRSYRSALNSFISYLECQKTVGRKNISFSMFSKDLIEEYLKWMMEEQCLSPETAKARLSAIRSFMEYASGREKFLTETYLSILKIKLPKTQPRPIEYFEQEQMEKMLETPDIRTPVGRRNQMMLILLYDTGMRAAELLGLTIGSIHLEHNPPYVRIKGKGNSYRDVPLLLDGTVAHLNGYVKEFHPHSSKGDYLFYATTHNIRHKLSYDTLDNLVKACCQKCREKGFSMPDNAHAHMFRKSRAMHLYKEGRSLPHIQQLLGHKSISTTTGFYAFATLDMLSKALGNGNVEKYIWEEDEEFKAFIYSL